MYVQSYGFSAIKHNIACDIYRVLILDINHVCAHRNKKNVLFTLWFPNCEYFCTVKSFQITINS